MQHIGKTPDELVGELTHRIMDAVLSTGPSVSMSDALTAHLNDEWITGCLSELGMPDTERARNLLRAVIRSSIREGLASAHRTIRHGSR